MGCIFSLHRNGSKYWRLKYRFDGRENPCFRKYPHISLADAVRERRDQAKKLLANGTDPLSKQTQKIKTKQLSANTFELSLVNGTKSS